MKPLRPQQRDRYHMVYYLWWVFATFVCSTVLVGQQTTVLATTPVVHGESFSQVVDVVELRDGRLLVLDQLENRVLLLDKTLAKRVDLTRFGSGPGEMRLPTRLLRVPEGVAIYDRNGSRFLLFDERAQGVSDWHLPFRDRCPAVAVTAAASARAVDSRGRLYGQANANRPSLIGRLDIVRYTDSCKGDTVASVVVPSEKGALNTTGMAFTLLPRLPFPHSVQWVVAANDDVFIAESDGFKLQRVAVGQGGRVLRVPYSPIRLSAGHKNEWKQQKTAPHLAIIRDRESNSTRGEVRTSAWEEPRAWPSTLPPFLEGALVAAADSTVWVRRTTAAGDPPAYDIYDTRPALIGRVVLRSSGRVIAVSRSSVYVVRRDGDDAEWLERYPRPLLDR